MVFWISCASVSVSGSSLTVVSSSTTLTLYGEQFLLCILVIKISSWPFKSTYPAWSWTFAPIHKMKLNDLLVIWVFPRAFPFGFKTRIVPCASSALASTTPDVLFTPTIRLILSFLALPLVSAPIGQYHYINHKFIQHCLYGVDDLHAHPLTVVQWDITRNFPCLPKFTMRPQTCLFIIFIRVDIRSKQFIPK